MFGLRSIPQLHLLQFLIPVFSGQLCADDASGRHYQLPDHQLVWLCAVQVRIEGQPRRILHFTSYSRLPCLRSKWKLSAVRESFLPAAKWKVCSCWMPAVQWICLQTMQLSPWICAQQSSLCHSQLHLLRLTRMQHLPGRTGGW